MKKTIAFPFVLLAGLALVASTVVATIACEIGEAASAAGEYLVNWACEDDY